ARCPADQAAAQQLYDPGAADAVELWPDSLFTRREAASPTGIVIDTTAEKAPWIGFVSPLLIDVFAQASEASGFARNGGVLFRFSEPIEGLPETVAESLESEAAAIWDLDHGVRVPFRVEPSSDGRIILFQPAVTLEPNTRHLAVITKDATSAGGCVAPSTVMAALLRGEAPEPRFAEVAAGHAEALADADLIADDVVAATFFRTHADHLRVAEAAEHASAASYDWSTPPTCEPAGAFRHCEAAFLANDYREADVVQPTPPASYALKVTIGLPNTPGPHPVLMFGHGLAGDRSSVTWIDDIAASLGLITVATDALRHGEHPTADPDALNGGAAEFLGLNLGDGEGPPFDTRVLKSNFNQTVLDRLQLLRLLQSHPDIDGDGTADLAGDRIGYWGISLGGLLGPGLLALSEDPEMGILSVGGGKLTNFVRDSTELMDVLGLLAGLLGGDDEFHAMLTVLQTMVDGGDPALWGAHVLRDRLRGTTPHLLLPLAMSDGVVPPSTGRALARSLGIPQMSPVVEAVPPLAIVEGPSSANVDGITAGYFQFDRVGSPPTPAGHSLPESEEALLQVRHFLETWVAGTPEIIDPYPIVGTPPL
ncbi:MAG: hypothetical protein KC731_16775, partial [Myxococcales bacterium]|nr:hypothetical protein [Myxococcales bacterium]